MTLEELIYKGTNTSGISNVSTRGQPTTSTFCKCVHRIAHSNYSNKEIINSTISWSSTSEGSDYWFGLYFSTESKQ